VLSDRFRVESRDVIGWTNEQESSLISFNFTSGYRMRYATRDLADEGFPVVNDTVTLDGVLYPAIFSVAVEITQR